MYIEFRVNDEGTNDPIEEALIKVRFSSDDETIFQNFSMKTDRNGYFVIRGEPITDEYSKVYFLIKKEGYKKEAFKEPIYKFDHYSKEIYLKSNDFLE